MITRHHTRQVFAIALTMSLFAALIVPFATRSLRAATASYYVNPAGSDANDGLSAATPFKSIQKAIDLAQPGTTITLAPGTYLQDLHSARDGLADARITLQGPADAVVKGGGKDRIFEINHDNLALVGFTIDGLWGSPSSASGYHDKLLYVLGKQPRDGVSGLQVRNMTFRNAGGECIRLRYFAQHNEISGSNISNCGVHDFRFAAGGKNGEGIYIGTAPEQRADGKNPTTDPDESNENWIHDNTFDTQGNECVDIKEAASGNIVENNRCTGQRDPESGGFDARGSGNTFRYNESYGNSGAGVRLGGDTTVDGISNHVYANSIHDNHSGGIKVQQKPQGQVCGNVMTNNTGGDRIGSYSTSINPTAPCQGSSPSPTSQPTPRATNTPTPAPTTTPPPASPTATTTPPPASPTATTTPPPASPTAPTQCSPVFALDGGANTFIEAEGFAKRGGSFNQVADAGRSNGAYMTIPGSGMRRDSNTYLTFNLAVTRGGTFYVWLLGYGPDGNSDSFFLQADDGPTLQANITQKSWGWKRMSSTLALGDGLHVLRISDREDGARVDKLLLTRDKGYTPSGLGGATPAPQCR
jgi:hypothetical protein